MKTIKIQSIRYIMLSFLILFLISCNRNVENPLEGNWNTEIVFDEQGQQQDLSSQPINYNFSEEGKISSGEYNNYKESEYVVVNNEIKIENENREESYKVKYKQGNSMILEYEDPNTGKKSFIKMKKENL